MEKRRQPLIDSITIPLSASSPLYAIHPFAVTLCCPPNDSTVGREFHGQWHIRSSRHQGNLLHPRQYGVRSDNEFDGELVRPFFELNAGQDTADSDGNREQGGEDQHIDIIVSSKGVAPVCRCVTISNNHEKDVTKPMVQSLTFRGRFPVNAFGKPKPLSLAGMVPAAIIVGGSENPKNRVNKCTIDNQVTDELNREGIGGPLVLANYPRECTSCKSGRRTGHGSPSDRNRPMPGRTRCVPRERTVLSSFACHTAARRRTASTQPPNPNAGQKKFTSRLVAPTSCHIKFRRCCECDWRRNLNFSSHPPEPLSFSPRVPDSTVDRNANGPRQPIDSPRIFGE